MAETKKTSGVKAEAKKAKEATAETKKSHAGKTVKLGFVAVGGRGHALLRHALRVPGVEVVAICDLDEPSMDRAAKSIKEAGGAKPKRMKKWADLLAMDDVQAVVSSLPCDLHAKSYLDTIAAGKDLYAEKPMCTLVADCDAVIEAAEASDRIVQVGFQRRANPRFIEPMDLIHKGELGDLVEGRIAWSNAWGPLYGWFGKRDRSGDWMVEQAVHNWDVMNWANGCRPKLAMGLGRTGLYREKQPDRDVTDYYSAIVQFENGVIVNMLHSWVSPSQMDNRNRAFDYEYTRLIGTRAGMDFNSGTISYRSELELPDRLGYTVKGDIDDTQLCMEAFINSVRTRKPPVATARHGRDAVLSCLLVREAVYRGGTVTMEELTAILK
jgi:predicted dehydrogenase